MPARGGADGRYRNHDGQLSNALCGNSEILRDEVEATLAENKYRAKMVTVPEGENKYVLVVWSNNATEEEYSLGIERG